MITARAVSRAANRVWRKRNPYQPKPRIGPLTYGAEMQRRHRERRENAGRMEYWMIGYDGPSPTPASAWPRMMEHAQRYGL